MSIARVELSEAQVLALRSLAEDTGRSQDELLRDAIDRLLEEWGVDTVDWRATLRAGEGIWEHRDDLPNFSEIRREMDRDLWMRK
jgi:hypothetical protein